MAQPNRTVRSTFAGAGDNRQQTAVPNLLQSFGIDPRSQEEILNARAQERIQRALMANDADEEAYAGEKDIEDAGAGFGALLRNKFKKPELTEQEKVGELIKSQSASTVKERMKDPKFRQEVEDEPGLLQVETLKAMSKAAREAGDVEGASTMAAAASEQYHQIKKNQYERRKANLEARAADREHRIANTDDARKLSETTSVVPMSPDGTYDIDNIQDNILTSTWDPETKKMVDDQGNVIDKFITLEEAIALKDSVEDAKDAAGVGSLNDLGIEEKTRLFYAALAQNERKGIRDQLDATKTQDAIMNTVANMFEDAIKEGLDPALFLDGAGKITNLATNIQRTVKSVGQLAGAGFNVEIAKGSYDERQAGKGEVVAEGINSDSFKKSYAKELAAIQVPSSIDATSVRAAQYQSAIVQLAYAIARSNEPGARQLSDEDFRRALSVIGADSASPDKLRTVVLNHFKMGAKNINDSIDRVGEIGVTLGLDKEYAQSLVVGTRTRQETLDKFAVTQDRYENLTKDLATMEKATAFDDAGIGDPGAPEEAAPLSDDELFDYFGTQ